MTEIRVLDASVLTELLTDPSQLPVWLTQEISMCALVAPESMPAEVASALRALERSAKISPADADLALTDLTKFPGELFPFTPLAQRIWELRHNLTPYDAWYVALAEALNAPLITADQKLARAAGVRCDIIVP